MKRRLFLRKAAMFCAFQRANLFASRGPEATDYQTFKNQTVRLFAWRGERVAFLTESDSLDAGRMAELCAAFDKVYAFYAQCTGKTPHKLKHLNGLLTVAEVEQTCGAACGYLGATGIELTRGCWEDLYGGWTREGTIDQALPYEFGRNFWFYSKQIGYRRPVSESAVVTGYAVFMRLAALDAGGFRLGKFRGKSGTEFRSALESLVDLYEADSSLNWESTLRSERAPGNALGLGAPDLFASFCLRLTQKYGGVDFIKRLWTAVGEQPEADSTEDAVDHFVVAASRAARTDLSTQFVEGWRWPVSEKARRITAREALLARP